jgi:hypothetical protein
MKAHSLLLILLLLPLHTFSQKRELQCEIVEWKFGNLGRLSIGGEDYQVYAKWHKEYDALSETMLFTSKHRTLIQKSPTHYYKTTYAKSGEVDCEEIARNWFCDWVVNLVISP